ncbi:S8 family serine peptidase [Brevifollis gellanilyticus]|uniref:Ig-like domain-containing protein n=1 Tax=Brevifollis gellanilyticus TaxID=748831 RepID=A0A512M2N9_9BACT|nr:S8 family serine peptidase [Brevifollis gellanilyticus]GEP41007.1 hypothetical protein BGE01nite_02980 [Brevifollis gellanilyticus]
MRPFLGPLKLFKKHQGFIFILSASCLLWWVSRVPNERPTGQTSDARAQRQPLEFQAATSVRTSWTAEETVAVNPLKAAGTPLSLIKILEMRETPANGRTGTRRSWLVETNFQHRYLRVDQELQLGSGDKVTRSHIYVADQMLTVLKAEADPQSAVKSMQSAGFEQVRILPGTSSVLVNLDRHDLDALPEAAVKLAALKEVLAAEPDGVGGAAMTTPNDPSFGNQWNLYNTGQSGGVVDADVDAPELWELLPTMPPFPVAVLDTGMDYNHKDLVGALWINSAEIPANGIDDDNNGKIDDFRGWDFVNRTNDPMDDNDHGTHVSGIIAARRNNGLGIAGIFPEARIVPVKVLGQGSQGTTSDLVEALSYVRTLGVKLVNMSVQGYPENISLLNELATGQDHGILYVVSAGNQGANIDIYPNFPGSFPHHNIICVGNSDRNDNRWTGSEASNYGPIAVDIFAPGTLIPSTIRNNNYYSFIGTSMSAPHVTAAAAMLWSLRPQSSWEQVRSLLIQYSEPLASLQGLCATGKRLNLHMVAVAVLPEIAVEQPVGTNLVSNVGSSSFGSLVVGQESTLTFTVKNTGKAALSGLGVSITGKYAHDFAVVAAPPGSLLPDASGTFTIRFSPSAAGERTALIEVSSNDPDESTFGIPVTGLGVTVPEIVIFEGSRELTDGVDTLDFGAVPKGADVIKTLRIVNAGTAALTGLQISRSGPQVTEFAVSPLVGRLVPGAETWVHVTFDPQASGERHAALNITSNDTDESPFNISLMGTGVVEPEISLSLNTTSATPLTAGESVINFGTTRISGLYSTTLVVRNLGTASLTITPSMVGAHLADFGFSLSKPAVVAPGKAEYYPVTCRPTATGLRSATLRITSNDADESPFDVGLQAMAVQPEPPVFAEPLQSQLLPAGSPLVLSARVTGDPLMSFQWKRGGINISGATDDELRILSSRTSDAAVYTLVADNPIGPPVTSTAYVAVMTQGPGDQLLKAGATLNLKCTVAAPSAAGVTVKYSWRREGDDQPLANDPLGLNGTVITGADKATLTLSKIRVADSGTYTCLVTLDIPGADDPELLQGPTRVDVVDAAPHMHPIPIPATVSVSESIDETVSATSLPSSFTVTGLPKGLSIDRRSGRITGKPVTASKKDASGGYIPNKITFQASNLYGSGPSLEFPLVIEALDPSVTGSFHGTVARAGHSNFGLGGHVQLTVSLTGAVSGSAMLAGQKHSIVGALDAASGHDPTANLTIRRVPASLGDLRLECHIPVAAHVLQGRIIEPRIERVTSELALCFSPAPDVEGGSAAGGASLDSPSGIAVSPNGNCYLADTGNQAIRLLHSGEHDAEVFADLPNPSPGGGTAGGTGFNGPEGLALDTAGNLYVADTGSSTIQKITPSGEVTTFAGSEAQVGSKDGTGAVARFHQPCALCFDLAGNMYVADRGSHLIRKITPLRVVSTLAGKAGIPGHKDGSGTGALFHSPRGITYDPVLKALFVTDTLNRVIRKVTTTGVVTTYAGAPKVAGKADGLFANARFNEPIGILSLGNGTLVVGDSVLVQLNRNGIAARISDPVDGAGSLDRPVALGVDASTGTLIAVHDHLHALTRHERDGVALDAIIEARRSSWSLSNPVPLDQQGLFNAVLKLGAATLANDSPFPQGEGFVQLRITPAGTVTWTGRNADGTTLTFGTFLDASLGMPLHVPLYQNTGSLQGRTFIIGAGFPAPDTAPLLDWYKIPRPLTSTDRSYRDGFTPHTLLLQGGKYVPGNLHAYLGLTNHSPNVALTFTQSLISGFSLPFTLMKPNQVVVPLNNLAFGLSIDSRTGVFTGNFKEGRPAVTVPFAGILIRQGSMREGRGHYLLPSSALGTSPIQSAPVRLE